MRTFLYTGSLDLVDVIHAVSVTGPAKVNQWSEAGEDTQPSLYWRQFLNVRSLQLSGRMIHRRAHDPLPPREREPNLGPSSDGWSGPSNSPKDERQEAQERAVPGLFQSHARHGRSRI
jgi:hypothetical protein